MELAKYMPDGLSQLELSKRLGHSNNGLVSRVVRGDRPVPLEDIELWAKALRLEGDVRERFIRDAEDQHTPPRILKNIREIESRVASMSSLAKTLMRRVYPKISDTQIDELINGLRSLPRDQREAHLVQWFSSHAPGA